ncbi:predicted protein [Ostreococcus lucimarinus CCE9901]|uniref:Uncharacterized protein n=1 Tax=Ostreococcus lucimarinus (strain CCE9901) TaxID=436017 RepID=A4S7J0_OSTLU|nr:predicted protein [Ostreococcus lucimarinus CCE9901]ABO99753.1 predicted protein [Ostreococcus lucimarinus CCE9901]|eukprot:XP_001421460.1 predicted protein [Ostreococcus lucimarinus CCE9901]
MLSSNLSNLLSTKCRRCKLANVNAAIIRASASAGRISEFGANVTTKDVGSTYKVAIFSKLSCEVCFPTNVSRGAMAEPAEALRCGSCVWRSLQKFKIVQTRSSPARITRPFFVVVSWT